MYKQQKFILEYRTDFCPKIIKHVFQYFNENGCFLYFWFHYKGLQLIGGV